MKKLFRNQSVIFLILILVCATLITAGISMRLIYSKAIGTLEMTLTDIVEREKALIEVLHVQYNDENTTIAFLKKVSTEKTGVGERGEFVIAKIVNDSIDFIISSKSKTINYKIKSSKQSLLPIEIALSNKTGFVKGIDYKGEEVFAAYSYIPELKWGIVAKVPVSDINKPYFSGGIFAVIVAVFLISLCAMLFIKITNPLINRIIESELRFRSIIENTDAGYFFIDSDGIIRDANKAWVNLYKYNSIDEILDHHFTDIQMIDDVKGAIEVFKSILNNDKKYFSGEFSRKCKDGSLGFHSFSARPISRSGKIIGIEGFIIDTTERLIAENKLKEHQIKLEQQNQEYESINEELRQTNDELLKTKEDIEESEERFRLLFENMTNGFALHEMIYDENHLPIDYRFISINPAFERLTGLSSKKILGKKVLDVLPNTEKIWIEKYGAVSLTGKSIQFLEYSQELNKYYDIIAFSPKRDSFAVVITDVTEKKKIEQALLQKEALLKQQNEEFETLNEELMESNEQLLVAKSKAEESDLLKTAFLQNMSHEVRTPMNSIIGFSQLLLKSIHKPEKMKIFSDHIQEGCDKLVEIINDVIEISHIHANQIQRYDTQFDLIPLIYEAYNANKPKAANKHLDLSLDINQLPQEYLINTDRQKISTILKYLLDNAIKFTLQGYVKLTCNLSSDRMLFSIQDSGIGISPEMQQIIFQPFRQVEVGTTRNFGGNGLGLAIIKAYVEMLNGAINFDSEINKGSTFFVSLPTKQSLIKTKQQPKITTMDLTGKTILIVEDEFLNYEYIAYMLEETNVQTLHAQNGQEAIDFCRNYSQINLVLMDIKMPVMNGDTATKLIKEFRPTLPIIAQTAYARESDRVKFIESGFDDYLIKPIYEEQLFPTITKFLWI